LVSLKGFLQLIKDGRAKPEKQAEYLGICWRNLVKLEGQINNLLDLARLSAKGEQDYPMERLDLGALLRTEVENLRAMASERRVSIGEPPRGSFMIQGNSEKMMQLIDNLLINAVKYNKENGKVTTELSRESGKIIFTVTDSGMGIEREQMAKIFNRFYRAKMTGTGRIEGLGIGLSLVQEIVLLHNGDIQVTSTPGQGTTFKVVLEAI
jgi:two-component system phosphate regulon sensor histidine kinase PhoR